MAYAAYPMPDDYPDYPNHWQIAAVLRRLRRPLRAAGADPLQHRGVTRRAGRGRVGGDRRGRRGEEQTQRYRAVMVANGHHWNPRWPEPPFPGSDEFEGEQIHVHHYREPDVLVGKRVLVLGIGNSATDIAVESSRIADEDLPGDAARRLRHAQVPRRQADRRSAPRRSRPGCRWRCSAFFMARLLNLAVGDMTDYGLPEARPQAARGPPDGLLGAAAAPRPRRHRGQAQHRPLRGRPHGPLRRRQRGGDRPRRLLHRLPDHLPVPRRRRSSRSPTTACRSTGGSSPLDRAGPLLHRLRPAAGADHADRRGPVRMGRRPARGPRRLPSARRCGARSRARTADEQALRRLQASHDRGRLPPLPARDPPRAQRSASGLTGSAGVRTHPCGTRALRSLTSSAGRARIPRLERRRGWPWGPRGPEGPGGQRSGPPSESSVAPSISGFPAGPPDQPEGAEDRNLEDHEQEEDRQEPVHASRLSSQPLEAPPRRSAPRRGPPRGRAADSVGTSRVGSAAAPAHS